MKKIFALAALFTGSHTFAQNVPSADTASLEEVVISATKFPLKTSQTGKVVTIISRQDIERSGGRDLSQILNEQGGIYINGANSNPGKDKSIYIRGGRVEHTLITIDGVPVYDASGIGSNFDIRNISIDAVERIEVLKGSQSTLYGSDAIAGVINIITRKSGTKPLSVYGLASAGSLSTIRTNAGINGKIKAVDYNIGYSHYSTKGISEAQKPVGSTATFDRDDYKQNSFQASLGIQASSRFRIQPYLRYTKNRGALDQQGFTDETDFTYDAENLQSGVRNEVIIGKGKLNLLYNFNKTDRGYLDDSTGSRNGFYKYNTSSYKAAEHFAEAFVVYPFGSVTLTAGADFRASNTQQTSLSNFGAGTTLGSDSVKQNQVALYSALNFSTANGFNVEAGGRFNHHSVYGGNAAFNVNPSYLISKQLKIFANVSSGYKTPSLYQLFSEYGNKDLAPETSINLEGGIQYFTKDNNASIRAAYFKRDVKDAIAFFYNPAISGFQYINQDKQKDNGIDVDARFKVGNKIDAKVFYTYVTGEITTKNGGKDTTYFNLYRRPLSTLTLQLGSAVTKALYVSANLQAVSNTKDITFDPVTFRQRQVKLKDYVLVNLYAEYTLAKSSVKFFADLRNVSNERYQAIYGYGSLRFTAYGGLRFQF